jgi:hypothetical protein
LNKLTQPSWARTGDATKTAAANAVKSFAEAIARRVTRSFVADFFKFIFMIMLAGSVSFQDFTQV